MSRILKPFAPEIMLRRSSEVKDVISIGGRSSGHYILEKAKGDSDQFFKVAEFTNLITDNGLLRMGSNIDYLNGMCCSSSGSPPSFGDSVITDQVGPFITGATSSNGRTSSAPYYAWARRTWTSATGAFAGNISKIAVGNSADSLFSVALVVDHLGVPTTLTVLSDERLRVTYEHRYHPFEGDLEGSFLLGGNLGGEYNFIARASRVTAGSSEGWRASADQTFQGGPNSSNVYQGNIGPVTGEPSGTSAILGNTTATGTGLSRSFSRSLGVGAGNFPNGISSVRTTMGNGVYQFQISPPIMKTSFDSLVLQFSHSWGRL